ncbi:nuclear transport factor 2 family protein [Actinoplanes subtropicus]|uniref:nuclear transport factor 2 family protein n=1 Tax=Actinoplanes subtropicus TaxID=543632 RepID=UPI000692540E|nr:nuclear transport factor 2 family protein [Actinoplanes subtropicus]
MPAADQIRATVLRYVDSFNRQDRAQFLSLFADDVVQIDPVGSAPRTGIAALAAFWDGLYASCDGVDFRVTDLVVSGDEAALVFHLTQTLSSGFVDIDGVDVFAIGDDGRIASVKGYSDADHVKQRG